MTPIDPDPLWLHSPIKRRLFRLACYVVVVAVGAGVMWRLTASGWGALAGAVSVLWGVVHARGWIWDGLSALRRGVRALLWHDRQGQHFSFGHQALDIHDDGRELWIDEVSVRKLLGLQGDPAFKARFAHQWREATELGLRGRGLWVKVSALHQHLADAPDRNDPRRVRLRTYLDRDLLQPAARRRDPT